MGFEQVVKLGVGVVYRTFTMASRVGEAALPFQLIERPDLIGRAAQRDGYRPGRGGGWENNLRALAGGKRGGQQRGLGIDFLRGRVGNQFGEPEAPVDVSKG